MKKVENMSLNELYSILLAKKTIPIQKWNDILYYYSEDDIYKEINKYYYYAFSDKLNINNNNEREKLYKWVQKECRYGVLEGYIKYILGKICETPNKDINLFILYNIIPLFDDIYDEMFTYIYSFETINCYLTPLNKEKVIDLVKKILLEIDPSGEWLNIYNSIIMDDRVVYINELSKKEEENLKIKLGISSDKELGDACIISPSGNTQMMLKYNGNIGDVGNTIHEFVHYISEHNSKNIMPILREFPSIFFELYAFDYLVRIGYSENEVNMFKKLRLENTMDSIVNTIPIRRYISMFVNNLELTMEEDLFYQKQLLHNNEINILNDSIIRDMIYEICDYCIKNIMLYPDNLEESSAYVIGNFLALYANLNINDNILSLVKDYTERMANVDPYELFIGINLPVEELGIKDVRGKRKIKKCDN